MVKDNTNAVKLNRSHVRMMLALLFVIIIKEITKIQCFEVFKRFRLTQFYIG